LLHRKEYYRIQKNNLKNLYEDSGFIHPVIERINVVSDFDSTDDFTAFTIDHGGPALQKILAGEKRKKGTNS
jgi:hypothetical protein